MKSNTSVPAIYGIAARYGDAQRLLRAARAAADAGYRRVETYTPFPVEGLDEALRLKPTRVQWAVFVGALAGGIGGFLMQYVANVRAYPLDIGGRPLNSWPAFIPISFELTILVAAIAGFLAFVFGCRLPEVHHPVFGMTGFERASTDAFFLCIRAADAQYDGEKTKVFLEGTDPDDIQTLVQ
jgi:hypothetical protein